MSKSKANTAATATTTKRNGNKATGAAERATAATSAAAADRTAQPGIIATIMSALCDARDAKQPVAFNTLLETVHAAHSDRPLTGIAITCRAQLSRLPNERRFEVVKLRYEGERTVYYSAGTRAKRDARKVAA